MDSNLQTSPPNSCDGNAAFPKFSNDAPKWHYRHLSPVSRLSSSSEADEKLSSLEQAEESGGRVTVGQAHGNDVDIIKCCKIAAMKAGELVSKNLIVAARSNVTTEQKKLLSGSKKSTPAEESGHRWDTALFVDRERQVQ